MAHQAMTHHAMAHHAISFVLYLVSVLIAIRIVPGIRARSLWGGLIFAVVFAILGKLLFGILTLIALPVVVLTFGLFLLVINAFIFWLADKLVSSVEVDGFGSAFLGSLVVSLVNWGFHLVLR